MLISYKSCNVDSTPSITIRGAFSPASLSVASDVVLRITRSGILLGFDPIALFLFILIEGSRTDNACNTLLGDMLNNCSEVTVRAAPV